MYIAMHLCLCFSVLDLILSVISTEAFIFWNSSQIAVREGDNVSVTCTATSLDFLTVVRIQLMAIDGSLQTVAESGSVKIPFSQLSRYSFNYSYFNDVGIMVISYKGIQGEDAGLLLCIKLGSNDSIAEMKVEVQVPVNSVYIITLLDGVAIWQNETFHIVHLREKRDQGIGCVAVTESPLAKPLLRVMIDTIDITQYFVDKRTSETMTRNPNNIVAPVREIYWLLYETMKPERSFNDRTLRCFASSNGNEPVIASATITVEYIPVITCQQYEHFYKVNDVVTIICDIESNPSSLVTLMAADKMFDDDFVVSEKVVSIDVTQVHLLINLVRHSHFGTYYLHAENEIGVAEVTLILHDASDGTEQSISLHEHNLELMQQADQLTNIVTSTSPNGKCCNLGTLAVVLNVLIFLLNFCKW